MSTTQNTPPAAEKAPVEPVPVFDEVPAKMPDYCVVGTDFHANTSDGVLTIPLRIKTRLVREIRDLGGDHLDQLFALFDGLGDEDTRDAVDELDIIESTKLAVTFFRAWHERQGASLGEARGSSI